MLRGKPAVFNIPAGMPFADSLARGILERAGYDPLALSEYTVLLPGRRAARTLREAFLRLSGGRAVLLPRMQPIGDVDADEVTLLLAGEGRMPDIPPAIPKIERQLLLARTVMKYDGAQSFDQAAALALELGRFLDEAQAQELDFARLANIVPGDFAAHWQKTLEFLKILTHHWPAILKERGLIDRVTHRNLLLAAQTEAWTRHPPQGPVIAAGTTGATPAAAGLLCLAARLPQGCLVLPGLDTALDEESWAAAGEDHPQHAMKQLLSRLGISRAEVGEWELKEKPPVNAARVRLLTEAMRPASTTEKWRDLKPADIPLQALKGLTRIDCDTPQEEAGVIALILREALETKGKTAALVTPDRRLARRVTLALRRWGIHIDDSGGQPLTELPAGAWLMLTAEAAEEGLAPVPLLAMLKHPLMAAALSPKELHGMVNLLDRVVLRGPRPSPGLTGLRAAVAALGDNKLAEAKKSLFAWLDAIEGRMAPFLALMEGPAPAPFRELLTQHIHMAESLAATQEMEGAHRLWHNEAGEAAADLLKELLAAADEVPPLNGRQYAPLLRNLLRSVTVRPRYGTHPRLSILGQVEARMYSADLVVLGGLNEDTWPALPRHDPWMSRPMRAAFGLPSPESEISLAAHDFVQSAAAPEVFITRARRAEGAPTVPARWLLRIETVLKAAGRKWPDSGVRYRRWLRDMDDPGPPRPAQRPAPAPPVAARPRDISVTQVEAWMRDPYQIYARKVLGLKALDPVDADPGGAERGTFIHAALEKFIKGFPDALPPDAEVHLLACGRAALAENPVPQEVEAFWWPRFEKIAGLFVAQEREWREKASPHRTEISGAWTFDAPGGPFTLSGKADRIDRLADGAYAVIDYKSGFTPASTDVRQGLSPQLPLEAAMIAAGGFPDIAPGKTGTLMYWRVTGTGRKPVEQKPISPRDCTVEDLVAEADERFRALVARFDDPATPYLSHPRAVKAVYSDYDHLARVREWGAAGEEE